MATIDRIFIDKNDIEMYKKLDQDDFLAKLENKDKFMMALSIGFKNKVKRPLASKEGYALLKYFKIKDIALMQSIALFEKNDPELLKDEETVYKISEEYAHAGIKILIDKIETPGFSDFWKLFEKELFESYIPIEKKDSDK